jgi:aspartate kinase
LEKSEKLTKKWLKKINLDEEIPVITGFWWWDENWNVYLFDRWWSDYVGTLVWKFLDAKIIEIWTDVDWVMSADPKKVKNPIIWEQLNYVVCAEFAIVWAKVLHPKTISPAQEKNIPIYIKNTFNPEAKWTKICKEDSKGLKGINIDDEQILIKFIDPTMLWWYGYVYSVLEILNDEKTKLDVIWTTETSFGISLKVKDFTPKLKNRLLWLSNTFKISIYDNITKVSLVGDNINFKVLSYFKEEIIMVSTSPYWKLLTIFVKTKNSKKLLNDLHNKIFKNV